MHFWIDKRNQTCGFSGRHRVPSSISAGGFGRRGVSGLGLGVCSTASRNYCPTQTHIKLMVTPVHRFQSVECVAANAARHHVRSQHHHATSSQTRHPSGSQQAACHHVSSPSTYSGMLPRHSGTLAAPHSMELDSGVFLDLPLDGNAGQRGAAASASEASGVRIQHPLHLQAHSQQPQQQQNHHMLPATGKLKCGMWASFAIVTVFMAGAKFYFNNQSTGMEVLIFCSLLVVVLFAGCTVSLCEAVTSAPPAAAILEVAGPVHTSSMQQDVGSSTRASSEELSAAMELHAPPAQPVIHGASPEPPPPPPPYHIAVLLPQQQRVIIDDSPPPSYEKAVS